MKDGITSLVPLKHRKAVVWADEQRPAADPLIILNIVQNDADVDRECYVEDPDNEGQWLWKLSTLYYIRLQVRVETQFNKPGRDAMVLAEHIRASLRRPDINWDAGIHNHPDINTYLHHVTFSHDGHYINAWSFETNFRAVVDFPLTTEGNVVAPPNMQQVEVIGSEAEPPAGDQLIDRPTPDP
jgi:hypothetical protein